MAKDASFKNYIRDLTKKHLKMDEDVSVGVLPIQIDMILTQIDHTNLDKIGLHPINKIFQLTNKSNLVIEYKSGGDSLELRDLNKILAYKHHLIYKDDNYNSDNTSTLIIATNISFSLFSKLKLSRIENGIYSIKFDETIYLIVINELDVDVNNYGLLVYSSGDKQNEFLRKILQSAFDEKQNDIEEMFISLVYVYKFRELDSMAKSEGIELDELSLNIRGAIESIGLKRVIDEVGLDKLFKALSPIDKQKLKKLFDEDD